MNSIVIFAAFLGITATLAAPQQYQAYPGIPAVPATLAAPQQYQAYPGRPAAPATLAAPQQYQAYPGIPAAPATLAAPQQYQAYPGIPAVPAPVYRTENFQAPGLSKAEARDDFGQYSLSYVTANGIHVSERSFLKLGPHGDYIPVREGKYAYTSPEGVPVSYGYTADENGFVVNGSPLPVAPQPVVQ